jgi:hypothetical protein
MGNRNILRAAKSVWVEITSVYWEGKLVPVERTPIKSGSIHGSPASRIFRQGA